MSAHQLHCACFVSVLSSWCESDMSRTIPSTRTFLRKRAACWRKAFVRDVCGFVTCVRPLRIALCHGRHMCDILGIRRRSLMTLLLTLSLTALQHVVCSLSVVSSAVGVVRRESKQGPRARGRSWPCQLKGWQFLGRL